MKLEEYDVSFVIKRLDRPPLLLVTYVAISEEHFKKDPKLSRKELIVKNSVFLIRDHYKVDQQPGIEIQVFKVKPVKRLGLSRKGVLKPLRGAQ
ncbi:MAG TPA: hypothetical protein GXX18_03360 [Bacillales bacterium]|nr:hypothetical protein [Bacillales bacterium]